MKLIIHLHDNPKFDDIQAALQGVQNNLTWQDPGIKAPVSRMVVHSRGVCSLTIEPSAPKIERTFSAENG